MIDSRILEKFSQLPEQVRDAVSEYIEYLYDKYDLKGEDIELTPEGEALLRERMKQAQAHPELNKSWEEVKQATYQKYGWKE